MRWLRSPQPTSNGYQNTVCSQPFGCESCHAPHHQQNAVLSPMAVGRGELNLSGHAFLDLISRVVGPARADWKHQNPDYAAVRRPSQIPWTYPRKTGRRLANIFFGTVGMQNW